MKLKKVACFLLAAVMTLSGVQSVKAEGVTSGTSTVKDVEDQTLFESTSSEWNYQGNMSVTYDDNEYLADVLVTIPKSVALTETKTATYDLSVKGEVEKALGVSVEPHDDYPDVEGVNFSMSTEGKDDVIASIEQSETVWNYKEITTEGTVKSGTITAEGLSRGSWVGNVTFDINMGEKYGMLCDKDDLSDPDHKWVNGVCSNCGAVDEANHTHEYAEKVLKEATCLEAGSKAVMCSCGDIQSQEVLPQLGHDVGEDGLCTRCGESHEHVLTETEVVKGSCTVNGIVDMSCECGYSERKNVGKVHEYSRGVCSNCGEYDKTVFSGPGLYSYSTQELISSWSDITTKTGLSISEDKSTTSTSLATNALSCFANGSVNPNQERYIVVLPNSVTSIGRNQFYAGTYGVSEAFAEMFAGIIAPGVTSVKPDTFNYSSSDYLTYAFGVFPSVSYVGTNGLSGKAFNGYLKFTNLYVKRTVGTATKSEFSSVQTLHYAGTSTEAPWGASKLSKNCAY